MRRSQVPSMRKAAKNGTSVDDVKINNSIRTPAEMQWGTAGGKKWLGPRRYGDTENPLKDKRIFLVLWRNQSNKKHKTWTGNGTLEVGARNASLKNEYGKKIGVLTCFNQKKIQECTFLEIDNKDVEVQAELKTAQECIDQRKEEIENWYRKQEESDGISYKPSNSVVRPMVTLKKKNLMAAKPNANTCVYDSRQSTPKFNLNEYICMLEPAELQYHTLQRLADYCDSLDMITPSLSRQIIEIAQQVCDHPVLLKHLVNLPIVVNILQPHLPSWQEMGLYDSAKFEFVYLMLDNLVVGRGEECAVVANSQICLDIIKGYCQCWEIPHIQLGDKLQANTINAPCTEDDDKMPVVTLLLTSKLPTAHFKNVILYNYNARSAARNLIGSKSDSQIYIPITAGCLEERQFQEHLRIVKSNDSLVDLLNLRGIATHELVSASENALSSWKQYRPPFDDQFYKETSLSDEITGLSFIYCKRNEHISDW